MIWWPGWNSADDANWWSNFYFWLGICSLLLLGASEVISHVYGLRKDQLTNIAEGVRATADRDATAQADDRRKAEVAAVRKQLDEAVTRAKTAELQAAEVRAYQTLRKLSDKQRAELISACKPFSGTIFGAVSIMGNDDTRAFRDSIVSLLEEAGWKTDPTRIADGFFTQNIFGVLI